MNINCKTQYELTANELQQFAHYRHKVFIDTLCWPLPTSDGIELDQFDRPDTVYVTVQNAAGHICGCARLLPTTAPYLLDEVFPQLLNGQPAPNSPDVWELSRFAAIDFTSPTQSASSNMSAPITIDLLQAAIRHAAAQGAKRLIAVTVVGAERLLRKTGYKVHRAGPPMWVDGSWVVACWVEGFVDQGL